MKITHFNYQLTQSICCVECYLKASVSCWFLSDGSICSQQPWPQHRHYLWMEITLSSLLQGGRRIWVTQYILITEENHQETETCLTSRIIFSQEFIIIRDLSAPLISLTVHIPPSQQPGAPGRNCRGYCRNVAMSGVRGSCAMLTRVTRVGCGVRRGGRTSMRIMIPPQ